MRFVIVMGERLRLLVWRRRLIMLICSVRGRECGWGLCMGRVVNGGVVWRVRGPGEGVRGGARIWLSMRG